MKRKVKAIAAALCAALLFSNVFASNMVLKKFDVSGRTLSLQGRTENGGEWISLVITGDDGKRSIFETASDDSGEFSFEKEIDNLSSGNRTAIISDSDSSLSVSFSGDGSYALYIEPEAPESKWPKTEISSIAYGNRILVSGKIDKNKVSGKNVTLVLFKSDADANPKDAQIGYIDETETDSDGAFLFDFNLLDDVRNYRAACFAGGENISEYIETAKTESEYIRAEVKLEISESGGIKSADVFALLTNYGTKNGVYTLIITAYDKNGMLIGVRQSEIKNIAGGEYTGSELTFTGLPSDTYKVKAMIWGGNETVIPLDYTENSQIFGR